MRNLIFTSGEFYHIYNRGVDKRTTFQSDSDYQKFMNAMFLCNNHERKFNRSSASLKPHLMVNDKPYVEIHALCLIPNHYHILLEQLVPGGISKFMQRLGNSYTKYFNKKYKRTGPLFSGNFKAVQIKTTEQLCHLSKYIHLNPIKHKVINIHQLIKYKYSSLRYYLNTEQSALIEKRDIMKNFKNEKDYKEFLLN